MTPIIVPADLWDDGEAGVLSTWLFEDGDSVSQGDIVAEVMKEKTSFEIAAPTSGVLSMNLAVEEEVQPGAAIGSIEVG